MTEDKFYESAFKPETTLKDEIRVLQHTLDELKETVKPKKMRLPWSSRVGKSQIKKGYIQVEVINDNKNINFIKVPIVDNTITLKDKNGSTIHAVEDFDIFTYKGKPFIHQAKNKINPFNPLTGSNQTYGQKYIMARLEGDKIDTKKKLSTGWIIGGLIVIAIIIYFVFKGGKIF